MDLTLNTVSAPINWRPPRLNSCGRCCTSANQSLIATDMLRWLDDALKLTTLTDDDDGGPKALCVMFGIDQVNDLHARLGSANRLPEHMRDLTALRVERYDSHLADGHSEYFRQDGQRVVSPPVHEVLAPRENRSTGDVP